ncbi:hypothetical protein WN51_05696 [Melipona quadrifasciata]|uniref:Uncharacterized protein n=1 Tax=Melipona quadrifasciata TaxID=166423 RepID=A0A0M9ADN4_9HYME|nr:hypothetical protein WN51_05696 [Melipona quadrifasciata]
MASSNPLVFQWPSLGQIRITSVSKIEFGYKSFTDRILLLCTEKILLERKKATTPREKNRILGIYRQDKQAIVLMRRSRCRFDLIFLKFPQIPTEESSSFAQRERNRINALRYDFGTLTFTRLSIALAQKSKIEALVFNCERGASDFFISVSKAVKWLSVGKFTLSRQLASCSCERALVTAKRIPTSPVLSIFRPRDRTFSKQDDDDDDDDEGKEEKEEEEEEEEEREKKKANTCKGFLRFLKPVDH